MQMIDCTCKKCGASLDLDIDDIKMFCPYCGNKLMLDISSEDLVEIIKDKGETKRKELEIQEEKISLAKDKQTDKTFLLMMAGLLIVGLICLFFSNS